MGFAPSSVDSAEFCVCITSFPAVLLMTVCCLLVFFFFFGKMIPKYSLRRALRRTSDRTLTQAGSTGVKKTVRDAIPHHIALQVGLFTNTDDGQHVVPHRLPGRRNSTPGRQNHRLASEINIIHRYTSSTQRSTYTPYHY